MALAATKYGARYFRGGGIPPFVITSNAQTGNAIMRIAEDITAAVKRAVQKGRQIFVLPPQMDVKPVGGDPEKGQLVELQRFLVEEIARILSLPPVFLQDLTHGTFSNTEQQDLHLVKHTLKRWVEQFEQEMNLKLFGRFNNRTYVEFNMDGLLRGDFITRMNGYSQAINTGHMMPSEAREIENRPYVQGSDILLVQGAMVPIESAGQNMGVTNDNA